MRHKLGYRKLNRTSEHRKALFKNMLNHHNFAKGKRTKA